MRKQSEARTDIDQLRKLGYETSDVSLPTLAKWFIALGIFIAGCSVLAFIIYKVFVPEIGEDVTVRPGRLLQVPPPNPELQTQPRRDIATLREAEDHALTNYAWTDRQRGLVRLPIGRAIELVAQRGLPKAQAGAPNIPTETPNVGNSGRLVPNVPGSSLPETAPLPPGAAPGQSNAAPAPPLVTQPNPGDQVGPAGTIRNAEPATGPSGGRQSP